MPISHSGLLLPPLFHNFKLLLARSPEASRLPRPTVTFQSGTFSTFSAILDIVDCSFPFRTMAYSTLCDSTPPSISPPPPCPLLHLPSLVFRYLTPRVLCPGSSSLPLRCKGQYPLIASPFPMALTSSGFWPFASSPPFRHPVASLDTLEVVEGIS